MKRSSLNKRTKSETGKLKAKLDSIFSEYIRRRYAKDNIVKCVTCGKEDHWKNMQCGHYIPRSHMCTRFREDNCHVQCAGCNVFKSGAMDEYALFMLKEYGEDKLNELKQLKCQICKWYKQDYLDKIEYYNKKLEELSN